MKRLFLNFLFVLGLLSVVATANAQRFVGSAVLGMNCAQIEGDDIHGFTKFGVNAGLGVHLPLNRAETWTVSAELLFAQKGSYKHCSEGYFDTIHYDRSMFEDVNRTIPFNPNIKCNISLDYVQIPVLFHYEDMRTGCKFGLGFSWSRLVRAKEIYNGFTRYTNVRSGTFRTSDWSILADADIRLYKNLSLGVRWEFSMVPIRQMTYICGSPNASGGFEILRNETNKLRNHLITVRLVYYINEQFARNTKTNNKGELIGTKWVRTIPNYN
ncbi:MAG: PorT family protein [Bacteroidales bacterium]|nr:PorT family protein [Bacteroidales bacterium]